MNQSNKLAITLLQGVPGARKTQTMLLEMLSSPGHYLVASPRIDLIQEQAHFVETAAAARNIPVPAIKVIYHEPGRKAVAERMAEAARASSASNHAIVFITHIALKDNALGSFEGWHAGIDEIPDGIEAGCFSASAAHSYFDTIYQLEPVGDGKWCHVKLRPGAPSLSEVRRDGFVNELSKFHKLVSGPQSVFVDVEDWKQARDKSRKVRWWSLWTPLALGDFASVSMTGANIETSLLFLTTHYWFGNRITYEKRHIEPSAPRAPARVHVRYFTRSHAGTTTFWEQSRGRWCLNQIARYFEKRGGVGFWSGNEVVRDYMEHRFHGEMVSPKQAGTNGLIAHTSCAMMYSNKAQDNDQATLDVFGFEKEVIREAREIEDIIQFVMRGAIRRPDFQGLYEVYVYDDVQARAVADYLRQNGISKNVIVEPVVDAGLLDEQRSTARAHRIEPTGSQTSAGQEVTRRKAAERQRLCRARKREQKAAVGTLRPRGRPRKNT